MVYLFWAVIVSIPMYSMTLGPRMLIVIVIVLLMMVVVMIIC